MCVELLLALLYPLAVGSEGRRGLEWTTSLGMSLQPARNCGDPCGSWSEFVSRRRGTASCNVTVVHL